MAPRNAFDLEDLEPSMATIFDQIQASGSSHKKNCVALYKLQVNAAMVTETLSKARGSSGVKLTGEKIFSETFIDMVNRAIAVKKGVLAAERIVKFVGAYAKFASEKAKDTNQGSDDTPVSRLLTRVLKYYLHGFFSKNKDVRFRVVNLVSEIMGYLGELDEELYMELRTSLVERLHDKEAPIRASAIVALSKLAGSEDPDEVEQDQTILSFLLECLCNDPAPEVRRAALVHLPLTPHTLPSILSRSRDVDGVTRKLVYSTVLCRLNHPKQLSIAQRELIVKQGLGDREQAVRVAAAKLLGTWVDFCEGNLVTFLQLFDIHSLDIPVDALKSIFVTRTEVVNEITFDKEFWSTITPETALFARTFVEHCISNDDQDRLESTLPVLTALAFLVQNKYNYFLQILDGEEGETEAEKESREDKLSNCEFILSELLQLATHLDFADEIGRRKLFDVVRNMLAHPVLPEILLKPCTAVLKKMSASERDLIRVIVEIINELRDSEMPETRAVELQSSSSDPDVSAMTSSAHSNVMGRFPKANPTPEEQAKQDLVDSHCLDMCIAVLEHVNTNFEENSTLEGILADLVIPAVKRKELSLREKGLVCLGLCCLLARNMAMSSFQLFLNQVKSAPEALRAKVIQIIFDIMITYEKDLFNEKEEVAQRVVAFLMQVLEAEESKQVQALICLGLSKLMLFGLLTDERVLTSLVLAYVSPVTADNQEVRQSLAYFLNAYCRSSSQNQARMQSIFMSAYDLVVRVYDDMDDDQDMITPLQFGYLMVDWTDPSKLVDLPDVPRGNQDSHVHLAIDIMKALFESDRTPDDKKRLLSFLAKLIIPDEADERTIYTLQILSTYLPQQCPFEEVVLEKAFVRFTRKFSKQFEKRLDTFDAEQCFNEEYYREIFEFMGVGDPTRPNDSSNKSAKTLKGKETSRGKQKSVLPSKKLEPSSSSSCEEKSKESDDDSDDGQGDDVPPSSNDEGTDAENASKYPAKSPDPPATPRRTRGAKRTHTPTKTPSMASPVAKKRVPHQKRVPSKNTAGGRRGTRSGRKKGSAGDDDDSEEESPNSEASASPTRSRKRSPLLLKEV